jgi:phosphoserine aminotransferase
MMSVIDKPAVRPENPRFSSGPCSKIPGFSLDALSDACLGRSHRAAAGKAKLKQAIEETRDLLGVPDDYLIAIVPASDTGAMEMALWSLLGARCVDILFWESFGKGWASDIVDQLKLDDVRVLAAEYGELPDLSRVNFDNDVVFAWNGTTSGVRVPDGDWIAETRAGLTICDATSAAFAQDLDFAKLDVATFSWQKVLGGEAAHGMLILSPRAVERLETHTPAWPLPKIFRLTKNGKVNKSIFEGATINTPSLLCVEDYLVSLAWARAQGGLAGLRARADANAGAIARWVEARDWVDFLAADPATRSNTSVCLKLTDRALEGLSDKAAAQVPKEMAKLLDREGVAYDIGAYRDAPPGLRIWAGATVEVSDIEALLPWLDWAYQQALEAAKN